MVADIELRVNIILVPFAADLLKLFSRWCRENVVEVVLPLITQCPIVFPVLLILLIHFFFINTYYIEYSRLPSD